MTYRVRDDQINGFDVIELTLEPYCGIIYTYGGVRLVEDGDVLRVKFDYDVHHNPSNEDTNIQDFRNYIGDILVELLNGGLMQNNLTYTGGTE
jgi:hypothetical protein